jgi:hypothetical protein
LIIPTRSFRETIFAEMSSFDASYSLLVPNISFQAGEWNVSLFLFRFSLNCLTLIRISYGLVDTFYGVMHGIIKDKTSLFSVNSLKALDFVTAVFTMLPRHIEVLGGSTFYAGILQVGARICWLWNKSTIRQFAC